MSGLAGEHCIRRSIYIKKNVTCNYVMYDLFAMLEVTGTCAISVIFACTAIHAKCVIYEIHVKVSNFLGVCDLSMYKLLLNARKI